MAHVIKNTHIYHIIIIVTIVYFIEPINAVDVFTNFDEHLDYKFRNVK